jgi:hypothetical protein
MDKKIDGTKRKWYLEKFFSYKNGKQTSLEKYLKGEHVTKNSK